jgi:S-adenosyl-L-methionine hydrolase (adenosine-forming)
LVVVDVLGCLLMITLLSDFGCKDAYVAVMKGVIAAIAPQATICDVTHDVPPQDILAARFNLMMAYPYFPTGTVHLAVVDPGVGSRRRAVAVQCAAGVLVGPDNGLFSGILQQTPPLAAVSLTQSAYWRTARPSNTFHGRDIFAPVAAHLANGVSLDALGDRIDPTTLVQPDLKPFIQFLEPSQSSANLARDSALTLCAGSIQYIDGFGNLISNIPYQALPQTPWQVTLKTPFKDHQLSSIKTYSDMVAGEPSALVGSHGWIEIACNGSSAAAAFAPWGGVQIGTPLEIALTLDMT